MRSGGPIKGGGLKSHDTFHTCGRYLLFLGNWGAQHHA
jgi:hypothetical protein